jgi:hypothetical protein
LFHCCVDLFDTDVADDTDSFGNSWGRLSGPFAAARNSRFNIQDAGFAGIQN